MAEYFPIITRRPDQGVQQTQDGYRATAVFDVIATGEFHAILLLGALRGVRKGWTYRSLSGSIPDTKLKAQDFNAYPIGAGAPLGGSALYTVEVMCSTVAGDSRKPQIDGPPVYLWNIGLVTETVYHDRSGNPIVNSAGEPFGSGVPKDVVLITLAVKWYVASATADQSIPLWITYAGAINSDRFFALAGEGQCKGIVPEPAQEDLSLVTANFEFRAKRPDGTSAFQPKIRDEDKDGNFLDGNGAILGPGLPPQFIDVNLYAELAFADIGIGGA